MVRWPRYTHSHALLQLYDKLRSGCDQKPMAPSAQSRMMCSAARCASGMLARLCRKPFLAASA
eukprot:scaffold134239_cov27-Tisochrysis_lutea.AAC.1